MTEAIQLFPSLPAPVEDALRESIRRFGVLVPVVKDQNGRLLDGNHRSRIADEIGVDYRVDIIAVSDDDEAREIARTLNSDRRHLNAEQRQEVAVALRQQGHSYRAIAGALGVSKSQVKRDAATVPDGTVPDRVVGLDGKSRPSKRPTVVAAMTTKQADKTVRALTSVPGLLDEKPDQTTAGDVLREARKEQDRAARTIRTGAVPETAGPTHRLICGDLASADVADESVALIVTDPPYPEEFAQAWHDLAEFAERVLMPGGIVVAMTGKIHLPDRMAALGARLNYGWMYAQELPGNNSRILGRHVAQEWKPWIAYSKGPWPSSRIEWHGDLIVDAPRDKTHYHWQQSADPAESLIRSLSPDGSVVCDPFLGSGTYGLAALRAGRQFIGIELDVDRFRMASERIASA